MTHKEAFIEFSDNGVGIEQEHIPHIFDMFYRAHASSKGSGLGLFIFKEAITRMGGSVTVAPAPGVVPNSTAQPEPERNIRAFIRRSR